MGESRREVTADLMEDFKILSSGLAILTMM